MKRHRFWWFSSAFASLNNRQRYQYRLKKQGGHSTLSDEREELLNQVGFVWDSHQAVWEEQFNRLKAFADQHGHCNVSVNGDAKLATWSKHQRQKYKKCLTTVTSEAVESRFQRLEAIGFELNPMG